MVWCCRGWCAGRTRAIRTPSIFLPAIQPDRKWPVIFCFDPVGRGQLPVRLLKDAAERFGYILAGSNDSRNGPFPPILKAQQVLWKEINGRFPVDPSRAYATGFSGGSRAALLMALSHKGRFAGVISCGAFDAERKSIPRKSDLAFYMLVGNADFNLFEFTRFDEKLTKRGHEHWLEIFDGPHRWPPESLMLRALEYMQVRRHEAGTGPRGQGLPGGAGQGAPVLGAAARGQGQAPAGLPGAPSDGPLLRRHRRARTKRPRRPPASRGIPGCRRR